MLNLQSSDTQKIQLAIAINFVSSKDTEEERIMHSTSDNIKFTSYNDANEVVNELFELPRTKYQDSLETSMKESDFIFALVQLMCYSVIK